jgi:hypothetical protein
MFVPRKRKSGHIPTLVSRKSANGFIEYGLRIIAAKPYRYFHQVLSFPAAITDAKTAKRHFTKFMKQLLKFYGMNDMACIYAQETRENQNAIHFHVCILFFNPNNLPFCESRMYRDFRTDIFKRWNELNQDKLVHDANKLKERQFNQESLYYFARALNVTDESERTTRTATNWWGGFNTKIIFARSTRPTIQERKVVFDAFFKKPTVKRRFTKRNKCNKEHVGNGDLMTHSRTTPQVFADDDGNTL